MCMRAPPRDQKLTPLRSAFSSLRRYAQKILKKVSDTRVANWPNTLAAQRKAKLDWKKERADKEEAERRKTDQIEAELQRKTRVDAIKRANQLMYEQTDKMKFLRGQQLYTDVIADREDQVQFLKNKNQAEKEMEKHWHEDMMVRLKESDRREKVETDRRKSKSLAICEIQKRQLQDTKDQLIMKLNKDYVEGQLMKQMVTADIVEEQRIHAEKQAAQKQQNAAMLAANMNLKDLRKELLKVEEVEAAKRKLQVDDMQRIVKARAALEQKHFDERQAIREKLIADATRDLEARHTKEENILEKHREETEQKYQDEMARRRMQKAKGDHAIDMSRKMQIHLRKERAETEKIQAAMLAEHWKTRNAEIEQESQKEAQDSWDKNWENRRSQEAQVQENRYKKAEARANDLLRDEQTKAVMMEDDERFKNFAQIEIERFALKGKRTFLLERARDAKDIQLLAGKNK
ncbi:hypothetical protein TL16_g06042 [Triparma laevis f. inornata]|uniref:Trichohyalin-plectin-homology domain-containing protein n=1 Tax=Triparma laevis f. inornata TaxID=1714386 RepID=A0A9W7ALT6_9STRA|nr:hypothetical protein TL16_g06042 [Triparma laevis f. inornata]